MATSETALVRERVEAYLRASSVAGVADAREVYEPPESGNVADAAGIRDVCLAQVLVLLGSVIGTPGQQFVSCGAVFA